MIDPALVEERVTALRDRIDRIADGRNVTIVAVTKGFGLDAVLAALRCGLSCVGENYAQELLAKAGALPADAAAEWHFLGRLQRNKVRSLAPVIDLWQSVDRAELIDEIARRAPGARILVQANLSGESQKGGAALAEIPALVERAGEAGLLVEGLMGVGPEGVPEQARSGFRALVALADQLALPCRSIGMTADLEVALQEGSTMIRVGGALFGPRPAR
ncbi:MAG: YggS family pyridoxal phosphate-dependent enzyme [Acidobacteria bacterium]|nr:YggS family pyridoxal phosphate-dependent enzyme [Acidobacteriota bacterium]